MSTTVLILAAGKQTRWEMDRPPYYKQLLDVAGETIIARIHRQCQDRGQEPIVVTHNPALEGHVFRFHPKAHRWTVETLFSTYKLWQERTIILLGDVVYSRTVMDRVFAEQTQELKVFGNEYEIYALSFVGQESYHHITGQGGLFFTEVLDSLNDAIFHAESGTPGGGKLRKFYQIYCGLDPDDDKMESEILDRVCYIQDYTRDVDTRRDYIELQNKVVKVGLLDDLETRE